MGKYTTTNQIFNLNPEEGKFRQGGWKTINGWNYEGKKLAYSIIENERLQKRKYTHHITINIHSILTIDQHKQVWKQASRQLRQVFTGIYIREPTTANTIGYHIIVNSSISRLQLERCLEAAFHQHPNTITIAKVKKSTFALAHYVCKTSPRYIQQRVYFNPDISINKHGAIGSFWSISPQQIWARCIEKERSISNTLNAVYEITPAAKYLHWCCDRWVPFRRIRRNLASNLQAYESTISALAKQWEIEYPNIQAHHEGNTT